MWRRESFTVTAPSPTHSFRLLDEAYAAGKRTKAKYKAASVEELRKLPASEIVGELSRVMKHYYLNFIRTGDPNGEGLPVWEAGTGESRAISFDKNVAMEQVPYAELYKILDEMYLSGK